MSLPPLDPHDVGFWDFAAPTGHFDNLGAGGNVALRVTQDYNGGLQRLQASPIGACAYTGPDYFSAVQSNATNQIQPANQISLLVLIKPMKMTPPTNPGGGPVFGMVDAATPTSSPYPWLIYSTNDTNGGATILGAPWYAAIKTVGHAQTTIYLRDGYGAPNQSMLAWNQWSLLALTYDGAHLRAYCNGSRCSFAYQSQYVQQIPITGALDYSGGSKHIVAGTSADVSTWKYDGFLGFLQVRDVAMTDEEMLTYWRTIMGFVGSSTPSTTARARYMVASGSAVLGAG